MGVKRLWKNAKGQSIVEFSLVFPVMIMVLLGTIDFGFILFQQQGLASIAKDTARAASVGKSLEQVAAIVEKDAKAVFEPGDVDSTSGGIVVTGSGGRKIVVGISPGLGPEQRRKGQSVDVVVTYSYSTISFFLPRQIELTAKSSTLIEETK